MSAWWTLDGPTELEPKILTLVSITRQKSRKDLNVKVVLVLHGLVRGDDDDLESCYSFPVKTFSYLIFTLHLPDHEQKDVCLFCSTFHRHDIMRDVVINCFPSPLLMPTIYFVYLTKPVHLSL